MSPVGREVVSVLTPVRGRGGVMDEEPPHALIDTSKAHPARVYDYWLGGKDNFAADRDTAERRWPMWGGVGRKS